MATSLSGAGGKIVTNRRKQRRFAAAPYDRSPPPNSPNWFAGVVVPSALAIASGAGKILSSIFSESGTSSSEDEEYGSEDDIVNDNLHEIPCYRGYTSNEKNATSSESMHYRQESRLSVWRSEIKRIIEQLIMKETFTREECDRLIKVLYSRIIDWSMEAGENSVAGSPKNGDSFDKAVQEAKRLLQEKKAGLSSLTELAQGTSNLNSETLEHVETGGGSPVDVARSYMGRRPWVETGGGSPVDVARSYMKSRRPWASPGRNIELKTPSTVSMKLFQEETLYSAGQYSLSPSKNRRSLASGSWNIQEELQKVRSRATEDMLCRPSTTADASRFAVAQIRMGSPGSGEEVFAVGQRMTEPQSLRLRRPMGALVHAGVRSLTESRQDGKSSEAPSSKPETSVYGNNEVSEAVQADAACTASKLVHLSSPNYAKGLHSDMHLSNVNCSPATEVSKFGGRGSANGLSSSQISLWTGTGMAKHGDEMRKHKADDEKGVNVMSVEGNCEVYVEVPIKTETKSMNRLCAHNEEGSVYTGESFPKETQGTRDRVRKQQGRKASKYHRKGRGRKASKYSRKRQGW